MSIEFSPAFDSGRSSLSISRGTGASPMHSPRPAERVASKKRLKPRTHGRGAHATTRKTSPRRVAANRRNALKSTGPRTAAGKRRASRNAIKHGLCSPRACLPGECAATYATFVHEIEEELQPRTPMQRALIPHIANLLWRIDRLPQAQADMFELELRKIRGKGQELSASQVIARRFSDDPMRNGFLLINRYERGLHNQLHRLMSRYDAMQKRRPTVPWPQEEPPIPGEGARPAWTEEMMQRQQADFARRERQLELGIAPVNAYEAGIDDSIRICRAQRAKRTQSNPSENRDGESETEKCARIDAALMTKRTQCEDDTVTRETR
jgi:hypothetical protein